MRLGIVIRFNKIKGYGFISPAEGGDEVFVHFSEVQTKGYKELREGQRVSYILANGDRGEYATQVKVME